MSVLHGQEHSQFYVWIPPWVSLESMQWDDIGPILIAGRAYTWAVGGDSTAVCELGFLTKEEIGLFDRSKILLT